MTVEEIKKKRLEYLDKLYNVTNANPYNYTAGTAIAVDLGYREEEARPVVDYLSKERLVNMIPFTGSISITHEGIKEVESAYKNPREPTKHFPPINIIKVGKMVNSQIQQAPTNSNQVQKHKKEIRVGNIKEDKKKGYIAGIVSILIAILFTLMVFKLGWNLSGQVLTVFSALFSILGIGSFYKPDSIGVITAQILENISRNYEEEK